MLPRLLWLLKLMLQRLLIVSKWGWYLRNIYSNILPYHHLWLSFNVTCYLLPLSALPWSWQFRNKGQSRSGFYVFLHLSIPASCPGPGSQCQSTEYKSLYHSLSCKTSLPYHYSWNDGTLGKLPQAFPHWKSLKLQLKIYTVSWSFEEWRMKSIWHSVIVQFYHKHMYL